MNVRRGSERSLWLKWAKKEGFLEVGTLELSLERWVGLDDRGDWEMILGRRTAWANMQKPHGLQGRGKALSLYRWTAQNRAHACTLGM